MKGLTKLRRRFKCNKKMPFQCRICIRTKRILWKIPQVLSAPFNVLRDFNQRSFVDFARSPTPLRSLSLSLSKVVPHFSPFFASLSLRFLSLPTLLCTSEGDPPEEKETSEKKRRGRVRNGHRRRPLMRNRLPI